MDSFWKSLVQWRLCIVLLEACFVLYVMRIILDLIFSFVRTCLVSMIAMQPWKLCRNRSIDCTDDCLKRSTDRNVWRYASQFFDFMMLDISKAYGDFPSKALHIRTHACKGSGHVLVNILNHAAAGNSHINFDLPWSSIQYQIQSTLSNSNSLGIVKMFEAQKFELQRFELWKFLLEDF